MPFFNVFLTCINQVLLVLKVASKKCNIYRVLKGQRISSLFFYKISVYFTLMTCVSKYFSMYVNMYILINRCMSKCMYCCIKICMLCIYVSFFLYYSLYIYYNKYNVPLRIYYIDNLILMILYYVVSLHNI